MSKAKNDKNEKLKRIYREIGLIEHKLKVLDGQHLTLRKMLNDYYMEVGVLERELGLYVPTEWELKEELQEDELQRISK